MNGWEVLWSLVPIVGYIAGGAAVAFLLGLVVLNIAGGK